MSIFELCLTASISIDVKWIPREENLLSDEIRKIFDYDDWDVFTKYFKFVDSLYGPHTFDRFADSNNKNIDIFNSRFYTTGSSGVDDAFSFNWES